MEALNTRSKLLMTAQELVQQRGFNAFSFRDLSERVGITTASIHYHFPTKAALGVAMVRSYRDNMTEKLQALSLKVKDPGERIQKFISILCEVVCGGDKICLCGVLASDFITLPDEVQAEVKDFLKGAMSWLAENLAAGKKTKVFNFKGTAEETAQMFLFALQGQLIFARLSSDCSKTFERTSRLLLDLL